jgi:hypothetical protein
VILTTTAGKRITVEAEVDHEAGVVFYTVAKVGTFTIGPDIYSSSQDYSEDPRPRYVHVTYGRFVGYPYAYTSPPEAPVIYGVTLTGGAVLDPSTLDDLTPWRFPCRRYMGPYSAMSAPDGVKRRCLDITVALLRDYFARPDLDVIERAHQRRQAPGMYAGHVAEIKRLREEIAEREGRLSVELARADVWAAVMAPGLTVAV